MKIKFRYEFLFLFCLMLSLGAFADIDVELSKRTELIEECRNNERYLGLDYRVICEENYHHYNSSAYNTKYSRSNAIQRGHVRIAEFNALHPGSSKSRYKDYGLVAKMLNAFDVVGVTELTPVIASDADANARLVKFSVEAKNSLKVYKDEVRILKSQIARRASVTKSRKIEVFEKVIKQLESDLKKLSSVYRKPGYLKILDALRALPGGQDWALILSPRGEKAPTSTQEELVGYYYRSSLVKPKTNEFCKEIRVHGSAAPFACIIDMNKEYLGEDKSHVFSRRPFMAEFISGRFSFTLISSHVIYDSPDDNLLKPIFESSLGLGAINDIGSGGGLTSNNWARFAEVQVTLEFINKFANERPREDIIFMGDLNLESNNPYWDKVLDTWPGAVLYIDEPTSTSSKKFTGGNETKGLASNYDHFIFNPERTKECLDDNGDIAGGAFNFQDGRFGKLIDKEYKVRIEGNGPTYRKNSRKYNNLVAKYATPFTDTTMSQYLTIKSMKHTSSDGRFSKSENAISADSNENKFHRENFTLKVLDPQLNDDEYFYFYEQVMSDHLPVYMECSTR